VGLRRRSSPPSRVANMLIAFDIGTDTGSQSYDWSYSMARKRTGGHAWHRLPWCPLAGFRGWCQACRFLARLSEGVPRVKWASI
jgi:hypothetical protein